MRCEKFLGRSPKVAVSDPRLLLEHCSDEAPGFSRLGTSVEAYRLRDDLTSSRESTAVGAMERSVFEPGNTGKTATWRLVVSRLGVSNPRG